MARIPLIDPAHASPEVRASFNALEAIGFPIFNVMKLFATNPTVLAGFTKIAEALYHHPKVAPRYRELAYLRTSQINSCHY